MLDEVKARGQVAEADFPKVFGRISFFVNAGIRLIEEIAKLRAMGALWNEIGRERYGVTDEKMLRFRYGVQVNCLGLTEAQPENNIQRIVLEALAVTLSRDARARALQLPAWNEAMGLPRPWDQQWSLRIQQVLANETDLLEYPDIFEGSVVMEGLVEELTEGARAEMAVVEEHGGAVEAVPYMKAAPGRVPPRAGRAGSRRGEQKVIGQNSFTETEDSPLTAGADGGILTPDPEVERERVEALERVEGRARRRRRRDAPWRSSPESPPTTSANIMPATIAAAKAGATTGEWADVLREAFGAYRGPDRRRRRRPAGRSRAACQRSARRVDEISEQIGHRIKILVGKPGLDGHSNGAEQIALRARDVGMEVDLPGHPPDPRGDRRASALQEDVDVVGLSILSGSHLRADPRGRAPAARARASTLPVVVGGIIPAADAERLRDGRRRRRLHAQGLRPQPDHGRDRRAGRRARPRRRRPPTPRLDHADRAARRGPFRRIRPRQAGSPTPTFRPSSRPVGPGHPALHERSVAVRGDRRAHRFSSAARRRQRARRGLEAVVADVGHSVSSSVNRRRSAPRASM